LDPFANLNGALEIAADALAAVEIENVKTDPVRPRGNVGSCLVIHPECPFLLAGSSLAHPVYVSRAFGVRKGKYIRPHRG
jgi:hypothetical protein